MRKPTGKLVYFHEQKPTRYKAFDVIVDSNKDVKGFVAKEDGWVAVMFHGEYDTRRRDFEYKVFHIEKGYVVNQAAYLFNPETKMLLLIRRGQDFYKVDLVKQKKFISDSAHKELLDFLSRPPEEQWTCYAER